MTDWLWLFWLLSCGAVFIGVAIKTRGGGRAARYLLLSVIAAVGLFQVPLGSPDGGGAILPGVFLLGSNGSAVVTILVVLVSAFWLCSLATAKSATLGLTVLALFLLAGYAAYLAWGAHVRAGVATVPELTGLASSDAARILAAQGLRMKPVEGEEAYDQRVAIGHVLRQRPLAGGLVGRGGAVEVVLSRGPRETQH